MLGGVIAPSIVLLALVLGKAELWVLELQAGVDSSSCTSFSMAMTCLL